MSATKKDLGVVTMVYKDYFFLKLWYDYYSAQVGAENLYVFSHGNDARHREIAPLANVMNVPRDPQMIKFDRRRWLMMGHFASGMLEFYRWMLVSDVDEFVIVDPDSAGSVPQHLCAAYGDLQSAPHSISPFGLNMIHLPEKEPLDILPDTKILSRRRHFYPSRVYSKPCLVRKPVVFGPGGHRNNLGPRHLSDHLYLVHLKLFDFSEMVSRLDEQQKTVFEAARTNTDFQSGHGWNETLNLYTRIIETYQVAGEDVVLSTIRAQMMNQVEKYTDQYIWGSFDDNSIYCIPERFGNVF